MHAVFDDEDGEQVQDTSPDADCRGGPVITPEAAGSIDQQQPPLQRLQQPYSSAAAATPLSPKGRVCLSGRHAAAAASIVRLSAVQA